MKNFTAVILAGGRGKRLKSALPKALYEVLGRPLVCYPLKEALKLRRYLKEIVVVLGYGADMVRKAVNENFPGEAKIKFVRQPKMLGTADALASAYKEIKYDNVLVLCADTPLINAGTIKDFVRSFLKKNLSAFILTADVQTGNSLGLILRDEKGRVRGIKEKAVSIPVRKNGPVVEEVNSGIYCFTKKALKDNLSKIRKDKKKGEYFLTDIVEILYDRREKLDTYYLDRPEEILGVNNQKDLWKVSKLLRSNILEDLSAKGVKIIDPESVFIESGVKIGKNTVIYPFTFIEKGVIIGNNCSLGPFIRIRGNTVIDSNTQVGNFLEINRTQVGKKVRIKHFGYLGDARVADRVNIGAGSVVANYDGKSKHRTDINQGAFIGSDSILVAPVKIGKGAATGAGSVVVRNVKPGTVVAGVPAREIKRKRG